jgi:hypothetical protein
MLMFIAQMFGIAALCGAVVFAAPLAQRFTTSETMPQCDVGRWPEFNYGFAALSLDLAATVGEPLECEHATTADGDTDQHTTTGLAHYDRVTNTPSFRQGTDNWAETVKGLVYWTGSDAEAPAGAVAVPSPGSARLAAIAEQNSAPVGSGVLGGGPQVTAPASVGTCLLTSSQIAGVAALLGIKDDKVKSMTGADVSQYTQQSGGSVAEVTRTINTKTH